MVEIPETRYARNGPVNIAYQASGDGPLDVALFTMGVSHLDIRWEYPPWGRFIDRFTQFGRLVSFDKRGSGLSDRGADLPSLDEEISDAIAVLDAAGVDRACLVGLSDGAATALALAARHPDRVDKVAVYAAFARRLAGDDYPFGDDPAAVEDTARMLEAQWGGPLAVAAGAPDHLDDRELTGWQGRLNRASVSPAGAASWYRTMMAIDIRDLLGEVRVPVLVTSRDQDPMIDPRHSRYLAEHLPDARHVEFPGRDHFLFLGDGDAVLDEIEEFFTGRPPTRTPTRALATVMFTDIVDSTRRAAELGDTAWREVLARHDTLTRRHVEALGGRVVKSTGDGALATFDDPEVAVAAAQDLIADLSEDGVELRVGLHHGKVEILADDVAGVGVHLAARISALAQPGEVLVSRTVRDLLLGSDLTFTDRGTHELKGVPGQWEVLAVTSG